MSSFMPKADEIERKWYVIDAADKPLGRVAAEAFLKNLKLAAIETHVADARTCCLNPATSTHRQMTDEQLKEAGVSPDLIRLSVGIENPEDILDDIKQALEKATK